MIRIVGTTTGATGTFTVAPVPGGGWDLLSVDRQVARFRSDGAAVRFAERTYGETPTVLPATAPDDVVVRYCRPCHRRHTHAFVACAALTAEQRKVLAAEVAR